MDLEIDKLMEKLSGPRPIFHSEADFQHAFAWQIQEEMHENLEIRLERGVVFNDGSRKHIDIWLTEPDKKEVYLIELKYKKKKIEYTDEETLEEFNLPTQSARDTGSFDFLHDVSRIEKLIFEEGKADGGAAIFLTNEHLYWDEEKKKNSTFYQFRLDEGRPPETIMEWDPPEAAKKVSREFRIELKKKYPLKWRNYSKVGEEPDQKNRVFRWLGIEVKKKR